MAPFKQAATAGSPSHAPKFVSPLVYRFIYLKLKINRIKVSMNFYPDQFGYADYKMDRHFTPSRCISRTSVYGSNLLTVRSGRIAYFAYSRTIFELKFVQYSGKKFTLSYSSLVNKYL